MVVRTFNFRVTEHFRVNSYCLKAFIENIEHSIFYLKNVNTEVLHNIPKKEREALKQNCCVRV